MGGAVSTNTASAIANASNFVQNSTTANTQQANHISSTTEIQNCSLVATGDVDFTFVSDVVLKSQQILGAKNDSDLQNNTTQTILQEATSKVGALGVGYANASNAVNVMANSTNTVINSVAAVSNQFSKANQSWSCNDSFIRARNIKVNFSNKSNFWSSQSLNNQSVVKMANTIDQSVTQKAKATVTGIGILVFILLFLLILIYGGTKVISSPTVLLGASAIGMVLGTSGLVVVATTKQWPYLPPDVCSPHSDLGGCKSKCSDVKTQTISLESAPLKYQFPIWNPQGICLVRMTVPAVSGAGANGQGGHNQGFQVQTCKVLDTEIEQLWSSMKISDISLKPPNPLTIPPTPKGKDYPYWQIPDAYMAKPNSGNVGGTCTPGVYRYTTGSTDNCSHINSNDLKTTDSLSEGVANLNIQGWTTYLNTNDDKYNLRCAISRFMMIQIINKHMTDGAVVDTNIWITEEEIVPYKDSNNKIIYQQVSNLTDRKQIYQFKPKSGTPTDMNQGISESGTITGSFGLCKDTVKQKQQKIARPTIYSVYGILVVLLIVVIKNKFKTK